MSKVLIGDKEYFPGIKKIKYEGKKSKKPQSFKYYQANQKVGKKTMRNHFKFACAYWHSFCNGGGDPFGPEPKKY